MLAVLLLPLLLNRHNVSSPSCSPTSSSCANPDNIRYRAQNENGSSRPEFIVTTTRNGTAYSGCQTPSSLPMSSGDRIRVRVSTPFQPISPLGNLLFGTPTLKAEVEVVVQ